MEQDTPNGSVRPILFLLAFAATKVVACIVLKFICLTACGPLSEIDPRLYGFTLYKAMY